MVVVLSEMSGSHAQFQSWSPPGIQARGTREGSHVRFELGEPENPDAGAIGLPRLSGPGRPEVLSVPQGLKSLVYRI